MKKIKAINTCPKQLIDMIKFWAVNYCAGIFLLLIYSDLIFKIYGQTESIFINQIFSIAFAVWIYYKIYQGKNWARFLWLAATAFGIYFSFSLILNSNQIPQIIKIHSIFSIFLNLTIFWIIFISPSRNYFSKENHLKFSPQKTPENNFGKNNETEINQHHWAEALNEFDGPNRKSGLYAQCFSLVNGNETLTKVEYLRRRASELSFAQETQPKNNSKDEIPQVIKPVENKSETKISINAIDSEKNKIIPPKPSTSKYFNSHSPTSFEIKLYTAIGLLCLIILGILITRITL